jgi:hypothetical protein
VSYINHGGTYITVPERPAQPEPPQQQQRVAQSSDGGHARSDQPVAAVNSAESTPPKTYAAADLQSSDLAPNQTALWAPTESWTFRRQQFDDEAALATQPASEYDSLIVPDFADLTGHISYWFEPDPIGALA